MNDRSEIFGVIIIVVMVIFTMMGFIFKSKLLFDGEFIMDSNMTKRTVQVGDTFKTYSCVRIQRIQK